jgi:hypothetical protein
VLDLFRLILEVERPVSPVGKLSLVLGREQFILDIRVIRLPDCCASELLDLPIQKDVGCLRLSSRTVNLRDLAIVAIVPGLLLLFNVIVHLCSAVAEVLVSMVVQDSDQLEVLFV